MPGRHPRRVDGGTAVVLTGASSGIGRATAHELARRGAAVVLAARSASSLEEVASEVAALGGTPLVVPTDIAEPAQLEDLVGTALAGLGRIDAWIGAASVYGYGTFESTPAEVFRRIVEVNLMGHVESARLALPELRRSRGSLVLVGSVYSRLTTPYVSAYVASKYALLGFASALRQEVRRDGVAVSIVLPATIDTPIYQHAANYTGRDVHPLPPVLDPARVARRIVRVLERPKPVSTIGAVQRLGVPVHSLLPRLFGRLAPPVMDRVALRDGPIPASDGTVFRPDPESNAVRGGWHR